MKNACFPKTLCLLFIVCLVTLFPLDKGHANQSAVYLLERGDKKLAAELYKEAIQYYTKALNTDPESTDARAKLAGAYVQKGKRDLNLLKGNKENALAAFNNAIVLIPDYYDAWAGRQLAYEYLGQNEKALAACNKKMALRQPDSYFPYFSRGRLYLKAGKPKEAIADFNRALAMKPDHSLTYGLRGEAYGKSGNYEQAVSDYTRSIELNPDPLPVYLARGIAYAQLGRTDKAIQEFNRLIKVYPKYSDAFYSRAKVYKDTGRYKEAVADLTALTTLTPEDPFVYYYRAGSYSALGNYTKAIADFNKALALKPGFSSAYTTRAFAYRCLGQYDKAVADYNKNLASDQNNPYVYVFRYIASQHGNLDEGNRLQTFADNYTGNLWISAVLDLYLGEITPQACLTRSNHTNPQTDREQKCEAYYYIGEYYLFMNNRARAKEFFKKCIDTGVTNFSEYEMAKFELKKL